MEEHQTASRRVELWVRAFAPTAAGPPRERTLERFDRLESEPWIDAADVRIWGRTIERATLSRRCPQVRRIERRLERFEAWAREADRDLEPFFRRRRVESTITGEERDVWHPPTVALAEFDGRDLVFVAPCRDGGRTIDVEDRLERLASASRREPADRSDDANRDGVVSETGRTADDRHRAEPSPGPG